MKKEYKSELFFSDEISDKIEYLLPSNPLAEKLSSMFEEILIQVESKIEEWENNKITNILSNISISEIQDHNPRYLICITLRGSMPWSEEKIASFKSEMKEKKKIEEDSSSKEKQDLRDLVGRYPDTALQLISELIKKKE